MYLLDSNILTEAKNRYYGFEICPGFWNWIRQESAAENVASIERIKGEIDDGDDDDSLKIRINRDLPLNFLKPDAAVKADAGQTA